MKIDRLNVLNKLMRGSCTMEGKCKTNENVAKSTGFTLVELLITVSIIGILSLATATAINTTRQFIEINKVKAYLLTIQAIQSKTWLETGQYLSLNALPGADIQNVSVSQSTSQSGGYEIVATRLSSRAGDSCRSISISETTLAPKECW